jgi:hypothetical protein
LLSKAARVLCSSSSGNLVWVESKKSKDRHCFVGVES